MHVSSAQAAAEIASARDRGLPIFGETCPQYLYLTQRCLCAPGVEGNKFLCSPPLRTKVDQEALWRALRVGELQVVSPDLTLSPHPSPSPSPLTPHPGFRLSPRTTQRP